MSISDRLKDSKLQEFIGPDGIRILSSAVHKVFAKTDADAVFDTLQLKSRAMFTWLQKSAPKDIAELKDLSIPSTNYYLHLIKAGNDIYTGSITQKGNVKDVEITQFVGVALPEIASHVLVLPDFENELNKSDDYRDIKDLQNVVEFLVGNFLFGEQKKNSIILEKGESQSACPDCGEKIKISLDGSKLCVCYRIFGNSSLHVAKSEDGKLKVTFGSKWDKQNIYLFAKALKNSLKK